MIWRLLALCCLVLSPWSCSLAGTLRYCDEPAALSAAQQDLLFRFGAVIKTVLDESGRNAALISRSGLDLDRFGVRYSHAGVSLKSGLDTPWAVRQLYYACDEQRPRVFDQGMAGFLLGLDDPALAHVSVVLLPTAPASELEQAVLDKRRSLGLLSASYSASAHPDSQRYQNCNQWVIEMLASAWGRLDDDAFTRRGEPAGAGDRPRAAAQRWLRQQGYRPTQFEVAFPPLRWVHRLVPWLHIDDHPPDDIDRQRLSVSMPASIEAFVQATVPDASRIEFCRFGARVVVHRGWQPIAPGCQPGEQDDVLTLE